MLGPVMMPHTAGWSRLHYPAWLYNAQRRTAMLREVLPPPHPASKLWITLSTALPSSTTQQLAIKSPLHSCTEISSFPRKAKQKPNRHEQQNAAVISAELDSVQWRDGDRTPRRGWASGTGELHRPLQAHSYRMAWKAILI